VQGPCVLPSRYVVLLGQLEDLGWSSLTCEHPRKTGVVRFRVTISIREIAMSKFCTLTLLLAATSLTLSCGSASNRSRQLQSIQIKAVQDGQQVQLIAVGTFSAAPTTVNPLPVFWSSAPPPAQYTLTTQPFLVNCQDPPPGPILAWAPANPNDPSVGPISATPMVKSSVPTTCGT
jgi:hypothetical protein